MGNFTEQNGSRKEEILAKSRNAKKDEGMEYAQVKGRRLGEYTLVAVLIPILVFALLRREFVAFHAVAATLFASVFGQCLMEYRFTKRTYHLIWTVGMAMGAIVFIVQFAAASLGWWDPKFFGWPL